MSSSATSKWPQLRASCRGVMPSQPWPPGSSTAAPWSSRKRTISVDWDVSLSPEPSSGHLPAVCQTLGRAHPDAHSCRPHARASSHSSPEDSGGDPVTKDGKEPDPGAPQPEPGLSRSYQRGRCSCHQAGSQGCLQALVQGQEHGAPFSPHALPGPLGEWCTCCGPVGRGKRGAGPPAAQGPGRGPAGPRCRLGAAASPPRHCAGATAGSPEGVSDRTTLVGARGDTCSACCPYLACPLPAQATTQLLILQLLGLAVSLVICESQATAC